MGVGFSWPVVALAAILAPVAALVVAVVDRVDARRVDVPLGVGAHLAFVGARVALPLGRARAAVDTRVSVGRALARLAAERSALLCYGKWHVFFLIRLMY